MIHPRAWFTKAVSVNYGHLLLVLAAALGSCESTLEAGFVYIKVVDSNALPGLLNNIDSLPQINSSDQIAVLLRQSSGGISGGTTGATSIVRWQDGVVNTIASSGGSINTLFRPAISDSGRVAFRASFNISGAAVLLSGNTGLVTMFNDANSLNVVRINGSDRVLTPTGPLLGGDIEVQSRTPGGTITVHASDSSTGSFAGFAGGGPPSPDINDAGDVALRGVLRAGSQEGIFLATSTGIETVADSADGIAFFGNMVDLNNNGEVAFAARTNGDPAGQLSVYLGQVGEQPTRLAAASDFTSISEAGPALNDSGTVLFQGSFNGSAAIFSGGNPLTDRIIGVGDALDGGTITSLNFARGMLSNSGNFVFYSEIDDTNDGLADRSGIFYASVSAVPEPSSVALLFTALALGSARAVQRASRAPWQRK